MARKKISQQVYLSYLHLLEDSFALCLQELNIMSSAAMNIAQAAEQRAKEDPDYDKWSDPIVKLCLDWVLVVDFIRQFQQSPESWSYEQNKRCWRMVEWNKHIQKLWREHDETGAIFLSDIV